MQTAMKSFPHFAVVIFAVGSLACPMHVHAGLEDLSPVVRMEYDLISGIHEENLKKARQPLADLDVKYTAALEMRKEAAQAAGNLDLVLLTEEAIENFAAGTPPTGEASDSELAKLGKVYLEQHAKLEASHRPVIVEAWKLYRRKLEGFITRLTKEGKIEEAKIIREEIATVDATIVGLSEKGDKKAVAKSVKDLLLSTNWKARHDGERSSVDVKFQANGTAIRVQDGSVIWNWKIEDGRTLVCRWLSSGWVKFEIDDLKASKITGATRAGGKFTLTAMD